MTKTCLACNSPLINKRPEAIYCSRKCDRKYKKDNPRNIKVCGYCGKTFNGKKDTLFCSKDCTIKSQIKKRRPCLHCGGEIKPPKSIKRKYCSSECIAASHRPKPRACVNCGVLFSPIARQWKSPNFTVNKSVKTCSDKCKCELTSKDENRKLAARLRTGQKHHNWSGGRTALNSVTFRGKDWPAISEKARKRDKYTCQSCSKSQLENGRKLDVHHIKAYHDINNSAKANRLSNLVTLCKSCHHIEEHKIVCQQVILPFAYIARTERRAARAELLHAP